MEKFEIESLMWMLESGMSELLDLVYGIRLYLNKLVYMICEYIL